MKMFRKMTALLLAVALVMALGITAFADTPKTNIKISGTVSGATYKGYRLLNTTTSLKSEGCHGTTAEHLSTCYNIAYHLNPAYTAILEKVTSCSGESAIVDYIRGLNTADTIRTFADAVYAELGTMEADKTVTGNGGTVIMETVEQGYWLIVEQIDGDHNGAYSLVILDTAGSRDVTVETKRDEPDLEKFVRDNGLSYGQGADMQIGDNAEFLLRSDVPNPIGYEKYKYRIHDNMCSGLDFNNDVTIRLNTVDGTVLDPQYYTVITEDLCEDCNFHIDVFISKATADGVIKADDRLYVTYTAKLNEQANILVTGQDVLNANPNTAWLEYSNNPYNDGEKGSTDTTQPKTVYVWTFPLTLNKVDTASTVLDGARFILSLNGKLSADEVMTLGEGGKPAHAMALIDAGNNTYKIAPSDYIGDVVYEIPAGTAIIQGFDDQVEYYLYETVAPDGYQKLSAPVSVKFFASYVSSESPLLSEGYPKVSIDTTTETSVLQASVVNRTGTELPSTGGIGTTIFYILGGVMVLGAVVLLITKKRMRADV